MKPFLRSVILQIVVLLFISACGTTAIVESHPAFSPQGEGNVAKVYFLRPDIGYRGIAGNAFSISLDGKELLTLAKGEYALVYLKPASLTVTVESSTVVNQRGMNQMTGIKESQPFSFEAGKTYHVAFRQNQREWLSGGGVSYIPVPVSDATAAEAAIGLKPVGKAMQEPISKK